MQAEIAFAPGAEDNPLAAWVGELIGANIRDGDAARRDFQALRAAVALVAPDRRQQVMLRFDHGHLTIHDGMLGRPDVTFCGDYQVLLGVADLPLSRVGRLPLPSLSSERRRPWRRTMLELLSGELKIYGLLQHPRLVMRILRVLSRGAKR